MLFRRLPGAYCHVCECWLLTSLQVRQLVQTNARRISQRIGISTLDPFALAQHLEDLAASFLRGLPEYDSNRASGLLRGTNQGKIRACRQLLPRLATLALKLGISLVTRFKIQIRSNVVEFPQRTLSRLVFNISNGSRFPNFHPSIRESWPATWIT